MEDCITTTNDTPITAATTLIKEPLKFGVSFVPFVIACLARLIFTVSIS